MSRIHIPAKLRRLVIEQAREVCEYCLLHQRYVMLAHHVDHILAVKHGGRMVLTNLALACFVCNLHKGADFATPDREAGQVIWLFNPRQQIWLEHFSLNGAEILGITPTGVATGSLLQLNLPDRLLQRQALIETGAYPPPHIIRK